MMSPHENSRYTENGTAVQKTNSSTSPSTMPTMEIPSPNFDDRDHSISTPQKVLPASLLKKSTPPSMPSPPPFSMDMMMAIGNNSNSSLKETYHPDFMFCGSCTTCQPAASNGTGNSADEQKTASMENLDDYLSSKDQEEIGYSSDSENPSESQHETRLHITQLSQATSTFSSHTLLLQSLLKPLAGVESVVVELKNPTSNNTSNRNKTGEEIAAEVLVRHTLQTSQAQLVAALKRGGYTSSIIKSPLSASSPNSALFCSPTSGAPPSLFATTARSTSSPTVTTALTTKPSKETMIVRSQFHVGGICCAMEIPAIRKIVKPLPGVEALQINITTKMVYVQHNAKMIAAQPIAEALSLEGFPAEIMLDGVAQYLQQQKRDKTTHSATAGTNDTNNNAARIGRTTLQLKGADSLADIDANALQQQLLSSTSSSSAKNHGIHSVDIDLKENRIVVEHDMDIIDSQKIPSLAKDFSLQIVQTAEEEWQTESLFQSTRALEHSKSEYVESTLVIANLQHRNISTVQTLFRQHYTKAQLRAFFANVPSQTIKVEHNPELLPVENIPNLLEPYGINASVAVDGKQAGLFLPHLEEYGPSTHHHISSRDNAATTDGVDEDDVHSALKLHVLLSGLFWVFSMLSAIGGVFVYFKYFGILSVFFGLPPVVRKAWRTLRRRQFDSNCMMVTAALGALVLQEFDEAASVAFLFSVSEFLEARSTSKARKALKAIVHLRPEHAAVIHPKTKEIVIVPASQVPVGSLLSVRTGDKIAADGVVIEGASTVDESSLTGESKPIMKRIGAVVSGGTINVGSTQLLVKTTSSVEDSVVSRLIKVVEEAQSSRSLTEKMIDRFAKSYTPFVVCMAAFMCTVPWLFGAETGHYWTLNGLIIIVIACPCSLTISTPVTYAAGLAATAQRGIIVKGGARLEALGGVETVVMDKTGTLTHGQFHVDNILEIGSTRTRRQMLELLALMEAPSSHPLSATLVRAARKEGVSIPSDSVVSLHTVLKGEGVTANVNGKQVYVGNQRLFDRIGLYEKLPLEYQTSASEWADNGATVGFIGIEEEGIIGAFSMIDTVREEAADTIRALQMGNIKVIMLTGDGKGAAEAVARKVGIPPSAVHSHLLPEDKLHFVGSLIRPEPSRCGPCRSKSKVLFIGDGINDTPALAVADVGVSMGDGAAALAMEISDVTLMDSNLSKLLYVINMGTRVVKTIQENIAISLLSKLLVVCLTFAGKMTLFGAIASDVGVMLLVTLNGMKLLPGSSDSDLELKPKRKIRSPKFNASHEYDEILKTELDGSDDGDVELGTAYSASTAKSNAGDGGSSLQQLDHEII